MTPWRDDELFSPLDQHLAERLGKLAGETDPWVLSAVALASRAVSQGHVCLSLRDADPVWRKESWVLPSRQDWVSRLMLSPLIGTPESADRPLILGPRDRLYLRRYWQYERQLVHALRTRAAEPLIPDPAVLNESLDRLFGVLPKPSRKRAPDAAPDLQREAAWLAAHQHLCILSGGPGTGKTTTVTRILAILLEQARAAGRPPLRILLAAPTGKAAARLVESIQANKERLPVDDEIRAQLPDTAQTLHRALGYKPGSRTHFLHNADHPLPYDIVLVDECSMVDLALMAKLADAIPKDCRWLLLGDRDQLASVEAGSVFGDLCNAGGKPVGRSAAFSALHTGQRPESEFRSAPGIWDCTIHLEKSFRFSPDRGIGQLARCIHQGDAPGTLMLLAQHTRGNAELRWIRPDDLPQARAALRECILRGFEPLFQATTPEEGLEALTRFRLLAAHRKGIFGIQELNALARSCFVDRDQGWFRGQPVLITENSPETNLYNGDTGVCWSTDTGWRVFFPGGRSVATSRLPPHEPAFAMTVHKSQGSEFDQVLLVLPPKISPVTTRELLYTAVTRARTQVTLLGDPEVISVAVQTRVQRASGLRDALWTQP